MELQFRIARHHWLEEKNAAWSVSDLFDRNVLAWIKNQYSKLEEERPSFKEIDQKSVFFFYTDAQDVYGRKITEILAVLVDVSFILPEHIKRLISGNLATLSPSDMEFNLFVEDSYIISTQKVSNDESNTHSKLRSLKFIIALSSLIVLFIGILLVIFADNEHTTTQFGSKQPATQADDPHEDTGNDRDIKDAISSSTLPSVIPNIQPVSIRDEFCGKFSEIRKAKMQDQVGEKCFRSYIEDQCDNSAPRKSYKKWVQDNPATAGCEYVENPDWDKDLKAWKDNYSQSKNVIRDFFSGKE